MGLPDFAIGLIALVVSNDLLLRIALEDSNQDGWLVIPLSPRPESLVSLELAETYVWCCCSIESLSSFGNVVECGHSVLLGERRDG